MQVIKINDNRLFDKHAVVVGYLEENKVEKLQFVIPSEWQSYGRKACFYAYGNKFAKTFDDITGDTITLTRDITQYRNLKMSVAFFKIENDDEIVARTSVLDIIIEDAIVCDDDVQPDDPKVVILDELIQKVTKLNEQVTKDEEIRQNQEATRQQNETTREENEQVRVFDELGRKKAEEERKTNELERISNENERKTNEEQRIASENNRVSNENAREEYINNLKTQVDNGDFDGADFNYKWDGTKLGVKNSKETTYQFVELKGQKGDRGDKGDKGDTGNGIQNIEKISTVENVDTYVIHYTDGTQTTFDVTNGEVTKEQLDEVDNRTKKTRNELERVKNDILETGTATDNFIHIEDSAMAELQELEIEGVCQQEKTNGINLLPDVVDKTTKISNGITLTFLENNKINLKGTSTDKTIFNLQLKKSINITKDIYVHLRNNSSNSNVSIAFLKDSNTQLGWLSFSTIDRINKPTSNIDELEINTLKYTINNGQTIDITCQPSLEYTSNITDYEPYTGGQPSPSPEYPQEIKTITGKLNLTSCNKNLASSWYSPKVKEQYIRNLFVKFPLKSNTTYTISFKNNNFSDYDFYSNESIFESKIFTSSNGRLYVTVKSLGENALKLAKEDIYDYNENGWAILKNYKKLENVPLFEEVQIAEGNSIEFEEHIQSQIQANLPEGEFIGKINDTYKDTLKAEYNEEDGKYHLILNKMIGKFVLDGSEANWNKATITEVDRFRIYGIPNISTNVRILISNYFRYSFGIIKGTIFNNLATSIIINYSTYGTTTLEDFKNWLSTHNTEVYYVLKTPYKVDLGPVEMPLSYNEVTNIFTDSDLLPQINAKYYRNFTKTVQNLQVNNDTLKNELISIENRLTALENANTSTVDVEESEVIE